MYFRLTDRQRRRVGAARELAHDVLAVNASRCDALATPPVDDDAALVAHGYHGMLHGGWGLDLKGYPLSCTNSRMAQGRCAIGTTIVEREDGYLVTGSASSIGSYR